MSVFADLFNWWGLSLTQTLLVLAALFFIIDIFFQSDISTHLAYLFVSAAVASSGWISDIPILFRVISGISVWGLLVFMHYKFWRRFMTHFFNFVVAPTHYQGGVEGLMNEIGTIKNIRGNKMVSVYGDLWTIEQTNEISDGDRVKIIGEKDGVLKISKVLKEEK